MGHFDPVHIILYRKIHDFQGDLTNKMTETKLRLFQPRYMQDAACYRIATSVAVLAETSLRSP